MNRLRLETERLSLVAQSRDETRAYIDKLQPHERAQVSPAWLVLLEQSRQFDPWIHGFSMVLRADDCAIGNCCFKGPPDADGAVEIAYGVNEEHQGKGFATEAAAALTRYAFDTGHVRVVRAHTLREPNASTRILTKCGFRQVGEVIDPDDGPVWRWEIP